MHLGLIGGIGAAATEFYYRGLTRGWNEADGPLSLTIAHADLTTLRNNVELDAREAQAAVFCRHVEQLKRAGADIAAVTSVGGHFCAAELTRIAPLPLLNGITVIGESVRARGIRRVGLLGTVAAMESALFGGVPDIETVVPVGADLGAVGAAYVEMAVSQQATEAHRHLLFRVGRELCETQGAQAVLLAGTDLFLAFDGEAPGFPVLDCAEMHIEALIEKARDPSPVTP
ncbi:MAG: aspartate/glutamate racemase family protein [Gammaproteobacteria bacterium]|nr:aspartate/glutamate racemase family protein [Gammaproteobacteria bacterium]